MNLKQTLIALQTQHSGGMGATAVLNSLATQETTTTTVMVCVCRWWQEFRNQAIEPAKLGAESPVLPSWCSPGIPARPSVLSQVMDESQALPSSSLHGHPEEVWCMEDGGARNATWTVGFSGSKTKRPPNTFWKWPYKPGLAGHMPVVTFSLISNWGVPDSLDFWGREMAVEFLYLSIFVLTLFCLHAHAQEAEMLRVEERRKQEHQLLLQSLLLARAKGHTGRRDGAPLR